MSASIASLVSEIAREMSPIDCLHWPEIYLLSRSAIYQLPRWPCARSQDCLPVSGAQPGL